MIATSSIIHSPQSFIGRHQHYGGNTPMLIKINLKIINTANIVSADFIPATDNLKGALTIVFVNNVDPANILGRILLEGDEAVQVWDALSQEAHDVSPV
jgi:hypothetical protein